MAVKVCVVIRGGNLQTVVASEDIDLVVVDYDNIEQGDEPSDLRVCSPDEVQEEIYKIFDAERSPYSEIRERLKELNF